MAKPGKQIDGVRLVGESHHPVFQPWHFSNDQVAKAKREENSNDGFKYPYIKTTDRNE